MFMFETPFPVFVALGVVGAGFLTMAAMGVVSEAVGAGTFVASAVAILVLAITNISSTPER